ncbi:DUF4148 domain-containing protein [Paraburkholderia phosphatilytica]|uniref:DUF4148 domain-containing protein n=1 Tax=Paraburkholderia phosphatilytica TaxID=2282883 RepID=UPI000E4F0952|nr:DUF4148 domain-containing protein [Paraburkholderia phosphatilytica]
MKLVQSLIVAAVVAIPALSFAQTSQPVTRAQVRQELIDLEKAGYNPAGDQAQYPDNLEQAQAKLEAQKGDAAASYGGAVASTSASGSAVHGIHLHLHLHVPHALDSADASHAYNGSDVVGLGPIYAHQ